jgi:TolB-like protein/Flp pilus assembly protein TadD
MSQRNFFAELKRRNVYKVAVAYAVVAWLLIQAASILFPTFEAPTWVMKVFVAVVLLGFPIALILAWAFELTPEGIKRTEDAAPNEALPRSTGRKLTALVVVAAVLAAALLTYNFARIRNPPATTEKSIAVLPLVNQSGDPSQEYFSDGLSEELINGLGQIHELRVIGRNSSFHFKGKSDDSRAVGQALGVANLLEGSVRKAGDRVRINVELVDAANGSQRWSQTYDRELKDIFAVQEEIAKSVADQLRVTLLDVEVKASGRPSNGSVEAYTAYLQGEQYLRLANVEGLTKAIESLDEAIRLDPRYAEAYGLKAVVWNQIGYFRGVKGTDAFMQARVAAKAGLAIKADLPRARSALAYGSINAWDLPGAEAELGDADDNAMRNILSIVRACQGRFEEAIQLEKQSIASDPANAIYHSILGEHLISAGRYDEAELALRKAIELQPQVAVVHFDWMVVALLRGQPEIASREAQLEPSGPLHDVAIALAQAASGDRSKADAALKALIDTHGEEVPFRIAAVYGYRKEPDKVFEWLERAYTLHDPRLIRVFADALLRPYHSDPRFAALCQRIGLPVPK